VLAVWHPALTPDTKPPSNTWLTDYIGEHLCRVLARVHLLVHAGDRTALVDQVADAVREARLRVRHSAVRETDRAVGVAQQGIRERELLREGGVLLDTVEAGAEDLDIETVEISDLVAEPATFDRSTRGVGLRVEPQQDLVTAQAGQGQRLVFVRLHREVRCLVADLEHVSTSS
jgi:hypothetical protein